MWTKELNEVSYAKPIVTDITISVTISLACDLLSQKSLQDCGKGPFKHTVEVFIKWWQHKLSKRLNWKDHVMALQNLADLIIKDCTEFVTDKVKIKCNYHDTYIQEILRTIDEKLKNQNEKFEIEFEVSLKQHICGFATRQFQKMHQDFLHENDPYRCLNQNKEKFRAGFKDVFHERDQRQKKAEEFKERCLKPAVEDFINDALSPDIASEMQQQLKFSTRMFFQYSILLDFTGFE